MSAHIWGAIWVAGAIQRGWPISIMSLIFILEEDSTLQSPQESHRGRSDFPEPFMRQVLCWELCTHKLIKFPTALGDGGGQALRLTDHETGSEDVHNHPDQPHTDNDQPSRNWNPALSKLGAHCLSSAPGRLQSEPQSSAGLVLSHSSALSLLYRGRNPVKNKDVFRISK